jgi:carboxypeptidase C (cathepsin A)
MKLIQSSVLSFLLLFIFIAGIAQAPHAGTASAAGTTDTSKQIKSVTHHSITIGGKVINYTATAGALTIYNELDSPVASVGYVAYTMDGVTDATTRPVMFAYNGGPGSSSIWLHMGALGPKRVVLNDPNENAPAPYKLEDNSNSVIDITDLVMIDPVGTGISHALGKNKNADFWGVDQDIKSVSEFIKAYVMTNDRWNSPKYLLGESYGTFRSAGVADYLFNNMGISLNGIILISNILDDRTLAFLNGDDLSYELYLPTYAAVAWFHNKLANKPADLPAFLNEVRAYASGPYATALMQGDNISAAEKAQVIDKLNQYTGLSKDYLMKADLRVAEPLFTAELLRDSGETVGRLDARYKGLTQDKLTEYTFYDPQSSDISNVYEPLFMNYYYGDLKMDKKYVYHTSAYSLPDFTWDYKHAKNFSLGGSNPANTEVDLADVMTQDTHLKVVVMNGYFDLATPFYATEYTMSHLGLPAAVQKNISFKYYEAGHMMYVNPQALTELKQNISNFITGNK